MTRMHPSLIFAVLSGAMPATLIFWTPDGFTLQIDDVGLIKE